MKRAAAALVVLLATGCSSPPPAPIAVGDLCTRCSRTIRITRLAGEIVDSEGRAFKFRTAECMAKYLVTRNPDAKAIYVTDYATGRLVKAHAVAFVPQMIVDGKDRSLEYVAYYNTQAAKAAAEREKTTPIDWNKLVETAKASAN